jgi:predicted Rossmann-fold nucleotide-binding protein
MKILFEGKEYVAGLNELGHMIAEDGTFLGGKGGLMPGALLEGVEDITQYTTDKDGNVVEVVPEPMEADK